MKKKNIFHNTFWTSRERKVLSKWNKKQFLQFFKGCRLGKNKKIATTSYKRFSKTFPLKHPFGKAPNISKKSRTVASKFFRAKRHCTRDQNKNGWIQRAGKSYGTVLNCECLFIISNKVPFFRNLPKLVPQTSL